MWLGHSFVSNGHFTGSNATGNTALPIDQLTSRATGEAAWIRAMDRRFNVDSWVDETPPYKSPAIFGLSYRVNGSAQAFSGASFYDVVDNPDPFYAGFLDYMIARGPQIVVLTLGVNDVLGGKPTADTVARADRVISRLVGAGIYVVAATIWPVSAARIPDGDARLARIGEFNAWLRAQGGRPGLLVNDAAALFGGDARANQSGWLQNDPDGLHPTDRAAYVGAKQTLAILRGLVAPGVYAPLDPNPALANLMPNAKMTGTSGALTNGVSGVAPTGYDIWRFAGSSGVAASLEASDAPGYGKIKLTITPVADATAEHRVSIRQPTNPALTTLGLTAGDWLRASVWVELSEWAFWTRASISIFLGDATTTRWTQAGMQPFNSGVYLQPAEARGMWLDTEPFQIPATLGVVNRVRLSGTGALLDLRWRGAATGTAVAAIGKPILRKVGDPRGIWNL
jgi:hypothetical protein